MSTTDAGVAAFEPHQARGRFNAAFFAAMGPYLDRHVRDRKAAVFAELPSEVVEVGPGVGANLRYLRPGSSLVAIEPNPHMHAGLRRAAERRQIDLEIRDACGERIDLPDGSADAVISSFVLCSVRDATTVVREIRRVLRPGGTFRFVEHVSAPPATMTHALQRAVRRPWAWVFEGCSCERDLATVIGAAGFAHVEVQTYRIHTPFVPFNTQIAGRAVA